MTNAPVLDAFQFRQYIDGQWANSANGATWTVRDPATQEAIREVPFGTAADARAALESAQAAFPDWSAKTAYDRGAVLFKAADLIRAQADQLAILMTRECGKPLSESRVIRIAS